MNINDPELSEINSRDDLAKFVRALSKDHKNNPASWENHTIESYLEALSGWIEDMDGVYKNMNQSTPTSPDWKMIARMLRAASIYS
jgi:hypothetical protein